MACGQRGNVGLTLKSTPDIYLCKGKYPGDIPTVELDITPRLGLISHKPDIGRGKRLTDPLLQIVGLRLELGDKIVDRAGAEQSSVFRTLQSQIADLIGKDVDDFPAALRLVQKIVERNVGIARAVDRRVHEHSAITGVLAAQDLERRRGRRTESRRVRHDSKLIGRG